MIQEQEVRHIAKLARLQLADEEVSAFTGQLDRILGFFDELKAVDTTGVEITSHPVALGNAFRPDEVVTPLGAEAVLANAPVPEGGYFRVPRILET